MSLAKFAAYAKYWVAVIGGALTTVLVLLPDAGVDVPKWLAIVSLALTALGVRQWPNQPLDK
ncbi:MAG: hypothetical protein H7226_01330 [Salinibacterium sp.]|nr:hypothetical protein [Salinibacterium sp.]